MQASGLGTARARVPADAKRIQSHAPLLSMPPFPPSFPMQVLALLRRYLGEYVRNIPDEALQISVWQGKNQPPPGAWSGTSTLKK